MVKKNRPIIIKFLGYAFTMHMLGMGAHGVDPIDVLAPMDVPLGVGTGFATSVGISGDYIVVGAPDDPWYDGNSFGAVYLFRRLGPTWVEIAKLTVSDAEWQNKLGFSVAIEGDIVIAGAPSVHPNFPAENGPGAVYVFRRDDRGTPDDPWDDTWPQEAKLIAPKARKGQMFGYSVAVSGNTIVGGKPGTGKSAEVFQWNGNTWIHEETLVGSSMQPGDEFGATVDIDSDYIIIGAPRDEPGGKAYVFSRDRTGWSEEESVTALDRNSGDLFASAVSIADSRVIAGAPGDDREPNIWEAGSAYIYTPWHKDDEKQAKLPESRLCNQHVKITASDETRYGQFGAAVGIYSNVLIVGRWTSPWAILFRRSGSKWIEGEALHGPAGGMAETVALGQNHALVGPHVYVISDERAISDFAEFQRCFGFAVGGNPNCSCAISDFTADGVVGLKDLDKFLSTFAGP